MDTIFLIMIELRKKYKSGSALEILQEAILSGDLQGGIIITQAELAVSLEVSRMPVREALIALEYQGLIERIPGQHVRIASLDEGYIRAVFTDMGIIEAEAIKSLAAENIHALSLCGRQTDFHRAIRQHTDSPLRRKFLETITEVYVPFVLRECGNVSQIDAVFGNLLETVKYPLDMEILRPCFAVYTEVLSREFMRIRKGKTSHA
ncbi:MAG: GntR family transcriptional regulator [Synergistaceae bacterium]|nr:GntR family transcriptional regulator [Synergistaceae bacterium]MBQ7168997.1 GntR family transcriptional regulator [Synergistaceae bacterium]